MRDPGRRARQRALTAAVPRVTAQSEEAPNPVSPNGWVVHAPDRHGGTGALTGMAKCLRSIPGAQFTAVDVTCAVCKGVRSS